MKTFLANIERSPFWSFSPEVHEICTPLFEQFGLNYFEYIRFYLDNTCISFTSERDYVKFFVNHTQYECPQGRIPPGKYLWNNYIDRHFLEEISIQYNHYHGITYVGEKIEYSELLNFAAPKDNENAINVFLNYEEALEYFLAFFLKTVEPFIQKHRSSRIVLPNNFVGNNEQGEEKKIMTTNFINAISDKNNLRKDSHFLKVGQTLVSLTGRELQCLSLLVKGCSAKQIARTLDVSSRTVETFCAKILEKTKAMSRIDLLAKLDSNTLNLLKLIVHI